MNEEGSTGRCARACPACGAETTHRFLWRKNACDIWVCESCRLGAADARGFDPQSYYTEGYFEGAVADGYADYRNSEPILRAEFQHAVRLLRRFVPRGSLLEIGAAYGFFLMEARAHYAVRGVEISEGAAAYARGRGLDVRTGRAGPDTFAPGELVDAIVMLDVIEHLDNPDEVIQLCAAHLAPGGVLMLTTGDFQSLIARVTRSGWRLMTPPQHLWYFGSDSITKLAARAGLGVAAIDHPWKRVPLSLILYQLGRMLGVRLSPERLARLSSLAVPINLFDAMRVIMQKAT